MLEIGSNKETYNWMVEFIGDMSEKGIVHDAVIPEDNIKTREIWTLREMILEATVKAGPSIGYDVSLNIKQFYDLVEKTREFCQKQNFFLLGYGHIGDYNLHINIVENDPKLNKANDFSRIQVFKKEVEKFIFDYIYSINGSISAEHGIGRQKIEYLHYSQSPININLMKDIKRTYDPNGILNPYKIVV